MLDGAQGPAGAEVHSSDGCCLDGQIRLLLHRLQNLSTATAVLTERDRGPNQTEAIHVLFAGARTAHRERVLQPLTEIAGLRFVWVDGVYGSVLGRLVNASAVVLSVSAYSVPGEHKLPRVMPLLALGAAVVSERAEPYRDDLWLSDSRAVYAAPPECLGAVTIALLGRAGARDALRSGAHWAAQSLPHATLHSMKQLLRALATNQTPFH
jgi:hypothetical protein